MNCIMRFYFVLNLNVWSTDEIKLHVQCTHTLFVFVADQLVLYQLLEHLVAASVFQSSYGCHQVDGNYLVILHSHLNLE